MNGSGVGEAKTIAIIGGGASGLAAAVAAGEAVRDAEGAARVVVYEAFDRVGRSIRSTDVAGVGIDNAVYLLMNQADEENLPLLTRRLGEKGLHVTAVPLDEQLRLIKTAKQEAPHV